MQSGRSENDCLFPPLPKESPESLPDYDDMCKWTAKVDELRIAHCSMTTCDLDNQVLKIDKRFAGGQNAAYISVSHIDRNDNVGSHKFDLNAVALHLFDLDARDIASSRPSERRAVLLEGIFECLTAHIYMNSPSSLPIRPIMTPALLVSEIIRIISSIKWCTGLSDMSIIVRYCDEGCIFVPLYAPAPAIESSTFKIPEAQHHGLELIAWRIVSNACAAAIRCNTREHRVSVTDISDEEAVFITHVIRYVLRSIPANTYARRHCKVTVIVTICFSIGLPYEHDLGNCTTNDIIDREVLYGTAHKLSVVTGHLTGCLNIYNVGPPRQVTDTSVVDTQRDTFDLVMRDIMITAMQ